MTQKEREDSLISILNAMLDLTGPIPYREFNTFFKVKDQAGLVSLEKENPKLGLATDYTSCNPDDELGVSTVSILATITDVLADRRLAAIVTMDEDNMPVDIIGFQWFQN